MNDHKLISVIMSTHNQSWELDKTLYSLSRQIGISSPRGEFEIIVLNTNPEDLDTFNIVSKYAHEHQNIRLIQVHDEKRNLIRNATYGLNLGARKYARGEILLLVVDPARVPTPGVVRKTRDEFERWGNDIVTTTIPYHFLKHYSDPTITIEEIRKAFLNTRWRHDMYCLFDYAAHTNISRSGIPNESTWLGITKNNYMKVGGHNETVFDCWSNYNLDLWRRLTRSKPKDNIQIPGSEGNDHWNKIGLGLEVHILYKEADFHLHHSLSDASRDFSMLKKKRIEVWDYYEKNQDCIIANTDNPSWGWGNSEEIKFE